MTIGELLPYYVAYAHFEWRHSPASIRHRKEAILRALKVVGDITPQQLGMQEVLQVKADLAAKGISENWCRGIAEGLRSFLRFCRLVLNLEVLDPKLITLPRIPRRDVVYLTPAEIERFLGAIPVFDPKHHFNLRWLGFRALVEVLLASGMRISEALSLKRSAVNAETGEAEIIGKGNKQRVVFFTPRALGWLKEYLTGRSTMRNGRAGRSSKSSIAAVKHHLHFRLLSLSTARTHPGKGMVRSVGAWRCLR